MKLTSTIALVLLAAAFAGCLSDPVTAPEIKPRPTFPPGVVFYRAQGSSDLQIRWTISPSDTQQNFRGYWVQLYTSMIDTSSHDLGVEDILLTEVDSLLVPRLDPAPPHLIDTSCLFHNLVTGQRYTAQVYGLRYPPQSKQDSLVLSESNNFVSFVYDPVPVVAPSAVYASSGGSPTLINLSWPASANEQDTGFAGYVISYQDTITSNSLKRHAIEISRYIFLNPNDKGQPGLRYRQISVPPNPITSSAFQEYPYKLWVKAIRKDSVESTDSVGIGWSGADRMQPIAARIDSGLFIGQVNTTYAFVQLDTANASAELSVHYDGTNVTVSALSHAGQTSPTLLAATIGTDTSIDQSHFAAPLPVSAFTQQSVTLPTPSASSTGGAEIYVLLPDGARARIFFLSTKGSYITTTNNFNTVSVQASFQPAATGYPYF